ncbi:MAG: hypothetical protein HYX52_04035 [Chloroflexi bacterium]|nr:hypothetical protein [Chloroflexota bacterium]
MQQLTIRRAAGNGLAALCALVALALLALPAGAEPALAQRTPTPTPRPRVQPTATPVRTSAPAASPAPAPQAPALPRVAYNEEHPVLAYYYGWWEPEVLDWGAYQPSTRPAPGTRQIADDAGLLRKNIQQAQAAGVDGFIANRIQDMARLMDVGGSADFRATYQVDGNGDIAGQLGQFYQYVNSPAMVRYQGRPVLFFWRASVRDNSFWNAMRQQFDPERKVVWLADGDNFAFPAGDAWDGISPYAIAWSPNPVSQIPAWGAKARAQMPGKLYVPPVSPGCDDSSVRAVTCLQNRADGAYYQATLDGALASAPEWGVVVSTWNEWHESTSIEPAVQYGDLYLQLTRAFADRLKSVQAAADVIAPDPALREVVAPAEAGE